MACGVSGLRGHKQGNNCLSAARRYCLYFPRFEFVYNFYFAALKFLKSFRLCTRNHANATGSSVKPEGKCQWRRLKLCEARSKLEQQNLTLGFGAIVTAVAAWTIWGSGSMFPQEPDPKGDPDIWTQEECRRWLNNVRNGISARSIGLSAEVDAAGASSQRLCNT